MNFTHKCTVMLPRTHFSSEATDCSAASSKEDFNKATGVVPSSSSKQVTPDVGIRSSISGQLADVLWYPIEKFVDEVPKCLSVEQWRTTCFLFLADQRTEKNTLGEGNDVLVNLKRRLAEVDFWARNFCRSHKITAAIPMLGVVLMHAPREAGLSPAGAVDPRYKEFASDMYSRLRMSDLADCPSHFICDFDSPSSLLECIISIAAAVFESRAHHDLWASSAHDLVKPLPEKKVRSWACSIA